MVNISNTIGAICADNLSESGRFEEILKELCPAIPVEAVNWPEQFPLCPCCTVRIAHDKVSLGVLFDVEGADLRATQLEDNGRNWEDSCCEMFISTSDSGYFNFEVNCIGSVLAAFGADRHEREKLSREQLDRIKRFSSLEKKEYDLNGGSFKWSVGILIPFDIMGLDGNHLPEDVGVNFYKCGDLTAHPHFVSWNPIRTPKPDFHRPEFFGKMSF